MLRIITGDCREVLKKLPGNSVHCCVTSPPYFGLRDYGHNKQIGVEHTPEAFVSELVTVFREVRRVLREDGTLWLNLGDTYLRKNLIGIPWMTAFALRSDGWNLRSDIIWSKPNPVPESVTNRPTKAHEYIFLLTKSDRYFYDAAAIREPNSPDMLRRAAAGHTRGGNGKLDKSRMDANTLRGEHAKKITADGRNKRSVWEVPVASFKDSHFAVFPPKLIEPCILAGCPIGGTVLDPFAGSGTTGIVANQHERCAILIELNPSYREIIGNRLMSDPMF